MELQIFDIFEQKDTTILNTMSWLFKGQRFHILSSNESTYLVVVIDIFGKAHSQSLYFLNLNILIFLKRSNSSK